MIDLIVMVLTLLVGAVSWYTSEEKQSKRDNDERDKELADQDSAAISKRLADKWKRLRIHNRKKKR